MRPIQGDGKTAGRRLTGIGAVYRGQAVFDLVRPSAVSVAFAAAKFHDLARLEHPPARIAVVHRKASLGDLLAVVAQAARVVEEDAGDSAFRRAAMAG